MSRKNICNYTYNYEPEMYKYILSTNILNKKKDEHKIFKALVDGYTCKEIGLKTHYSERTIQTRRKDIFDKKSYNVIMIIKEDYYEIE